ncbi:extracellular solute-binding protein [Paenibacillus sp. PR3]|uniref:Extracellular solute-binding protein n=1 Tax=Paenibacillus terricola TaxID=2763503 RepID=A0ABR8N024_9BACL|nr:extracellular solute-binding protein [Paenibacillus terricola]MBD3921190.1 extracellular solute-binding protein [Paenibacillus terricola]
MLKKIASRLGLIMFVAVILSVSACSSDTNGGKDTEAIEDWEDGFVEDSSAKPVDTDTVDKASEQLDPITLTVHYFAQDDFTLPVLQKAAEGYTKNHPEVNVVWKLHPRTQPVKLDQLMEPGEAQDLYWIENRADLQDFIADGLVQDLSSYQSDMGGDAYYDSLVSSLMVDGGIYGFPIVNSSMMIFYNKKLMTGDSMPTLNWTYENMIRSVRTIMQQQQLKTGLEQGGLLLLPAGQSYGGDPLNEAMTKLELNAEFRQGLSVMLDALNVDKISGDVEAGASSYTNQFSQGEVPMMVGFSQQLRDVLTLMPDVDIAPFPAGAMKQQGAGTIEALAVSKKSEHSNQAIEFAQYMSGSEDANIVYANEHVTMPLVLSDKVREAWRSSFKDPTMADRLEYIVKTNEGNLFSLNGAPGYGDAAMRLQILALDVVDGQAGKSFTANAKFDEELDRINADWAMAQEKAAKR